MCDYCFGGRILFSTHDPENHLRFISIANHCLLVLTDSADMINGIPIKFCPMCGMSLENQNDLLITNLKDEMSSRTFNCLRYAGIHSLREVACMTFDEVIRIRNIGRRSVKELEDLLAKYGLYLKGESV